jgi:hypothetical protein
MSYAIPLANNRPPASQADRRDLALATAAVGIRSRPALPRHTIIDESIILENPMADLLEKKGRIIFLEAHDPGAGYGPPGDELDTEAVFILNALDQGACGFQLRNDAKLPARQAMFALLRDAFVNDRTVIVDYLIEPGKKNGVAIRLALIKE